jgi:TolB-like protein
MFNTSRGGRGPHSRGVALRTAFSTSSCYTDIRPTLMKGIAMGRSPVASYTTNKDAIPEQAIRDQLSRILESSMFIQSERLGRFLRFTVETTLAGDAGSLKEYLIGTEVYERKPSYHPGEDSIVRSEARRLRRKVKEYYESDGKDDPVLIYYRPGSYVPVFSLRELFSERRGIRIAVLPFVDASSSILSGECAQFITDELIHELVRTEGLHVTTASSVGPLVAQALDIPSLARKLDVHIVFEGTVREDNNQLRVSVRVVNADGFHILSERFETKSDPQGVFKVSEKIVSELISRVGREQSRVDKLQSTLGPATVIINPTSNPSELTENRLYP